MASLEVAYFLIGLLKCAYKGYSDNSMEIRIENTAISALKSGGYSVQIRKDDYCLMSDVSYVSGKPPELTAMAERTLGARASRKCLFVYL